MVNHVIFGRLCYFLESKTALSGSFWYIFIFMEQIKIIWFVEQAPPQNIALVGVSPRVMLKWAKSLGVLVTASFTSRRHEDIFLRRQCAWRES